MRFDDFVKGLGTSGSAFRSSYEQDSDWALIIKLNAHVESALTFLIVKRLGDDRLEEIFTHIELGDSKKGKIAFVRAMDLLPSPYRGFIQRLFELRNLLAHGVARLDFDIKSHISGLKTKPYNEFKGSVIPVLTDFLHGLPERLAAREFEENPRLAIFICTMAVLTRADSSARGNLLLREK